MLRRYCFQILVLMRWKPPRLQAHPGLAGLCRHDGISRIMSSNPIKLFAFAGVAAAIAAGFLAQGLDGAEHGNAPASSLVQGMSVETAPAPVCRMQPRARNPL